MTPNQVIKVFATTQPADFDCPWQTHAPQSSTGSGVAIAGRRILTGAHVVADATFVQVQKTTDPRKYVARVAAAAHDCDLALLSVEDDAFWVDIQAAEIGDQPALRDEVTVVGFPIGGEEVSYTQGVVSRIELTSYTHSHQRLLAITVDAAINPGNSGGPAYAEDGRVVGIAFQKRRDAENIGYLVPTVLVNRFLEAVAKGHPLQAPALGLRLQTLENATLRVALGLPADGHGVRVVEIGYGGSAWRKLKVDDVITHIAGLPVADNGTVQYAGGVRSGLTVALSDFHVGDGIEVRVVREGAPRTLTLTLAPDASLVPRDQYDRRPDFFIWAGLVFQPLTLDYLRTWNKLSSAPRELVTLYYRALRTAKRREAVVLTGVLAHEVNAGYDRYDDRLVEAVGGERVVDLADLAARLGAATDRVDIRLDSGATLVLDAEAAHAAHDAILERYRVPTDREGIP